MPPLSASRFSVSGNSMNFTPLIHVVTFGGFPSMRARSSFHSPGFQNFGQSAALTGQGNGLFSARDLGHVLAKSKFRTFGLPPIPSP